MINFDKDIYHIQSSLPGPCLAIITGVHGNELTGPLAIKQLLPTLKVTKGQLYVILANPPALGQNVRQISKNLNRCFFAGNKGRSYEDKRARQIMKILDQCDAMLDLHAYNEPFGDPFVMTEPNGLEIAKIVDVGIISTNWTQAEANTTDAYMYLSGKIGLCLECGPIPQANKHIEFTTNSIFQFLDCYGMTNAKVKKTTRPQRIIQAQRAVIRQSENFSLNPGLRSFDKLSKGAVYGSQNGVDFVAGKGECIIFPRPQAPLGSEAFIIGKEL